MKNTRSFEFLFLSAISGIVLFKIFICFFILGGRTKDDDFNLYLWGWLFFPVLGMLLGRFLLSVGKKFHALNSFFYPVFLFSNFSFILYWLLPSQWDKPGWLLTIYFLMIQALSMLIIMILGLIFPNEAGKWNEIPYLLMVLSLGLWLLRLDTFLPNFLSQWSIFHYLTFLGITTVLYFGMSGNSKVHLLNGIFSHHATRPLTKVALYSSAFIFIFYLVVEPSFSFDPYHSSTFLAPIADLRAGKSLMVDINAQYGVFVYYFLDFFFNFLPLGFRSFCLVLTGLYVLQYFLFYFIVRQLFESEIISFFSLATVLLISYFATAGQATWYPSIGPLRFGFIYLLMTLAILRNRHPQRQKMFLVIETVVVSIAFLWSFEVSFYTVPAYVGLIFYESLEVRNEAVGFDVRNFFERMSAFLVLAAIFLFLFYADVFRRTGRFPDWSMYFDYIALYKNGFFMRWLPGFGCWWLIVGILYFSSFAILGLTFNSPKDAIKPPHFNVIVLLTFYGITQFYYYLGRSVGFNLLAVSMPSLLLFMYWLFFLKRFDPPTIPFTLKKAGYIFAVTAIGINLQLFIPRSLKKIDLKMGSLPNLAENIAQAAKDEPRDDRFEQKAEALMEKYSGNKRELVYFFGDKGLEVSMYSGRVKAYPYNAIFEADICPPIRARLLSFDPHLKLGDYFYLSKDLSQCDIYYEYPDSSRHVRSTLEPELLLKLASKYDSKIVEEKDGIAVFRVTGIR